MAHTPYSIFSLSLSFSLSDSLIYTLFHLPLNVLKQYLLKAIYEKAKIEFRQWIKFLT